jgi:hypothetical protein
LRGQISIERTKEQSDRSWPDRHHHARSEGLIVVTNNLREFARMPGSEPRAGPN